MTKQLPISNTSAKICGELTPHLFTPSDNELQNYSAKSHLKVHIQNASHVRLRTHRKLRLWPDEYATRRALFRIKGKLARIAYFNFPFRKIFLKISRSFTDRGPGLHLDSCWNYKSQPLPWIEGLFLHLRRAFLIPGQSKMINPGSWCRKRGTEMMEERAAHSTACSGPP